MAYQYRSEGELRFTAKYVRALGIGGMSVFPVFVLIAILAELSSGWRFVLTGTGFCMFLLGSFEYWVASKVLRGLPQETKS